MVGLHGQWVFMSTPYSVQKGKSAFTKPFGCSRHGLLVRQSTMAFLSALVKGQNV